LVIRERQGGDGAATRGQDALLRSRVSPLHNCLKRAATSIPPAIAGRGFFSSSMMIAVVNKASRALVSPSIVSGVRSATSTEPDMALMNC